MYEMRINFFYWEVEELEYFVKYYENEVSDK